MRCGDFQLRVGEQHKSPGDRDAEEDERSGKPGSGGGARVLLLHGPGGESDSTDVRGGRRGRFPAPGGTSADAAADTAQHPASFGFHCVPAFDHGKVGQEEAKKVGTREEER